ncbi:HEPN domain-containing protein, partial [Klebsiella aerogenes]
LYRRLLTALDWFRQSFSARANEAEAIVALAVAFETLLTDQYAPAIAERLRRRIGICIKGVPGVANYQASVL